MTYYLNEFNSNVWYPCSESGMITGEQLLGAPDADLVRHEDRGIYAIWRVLHWNEPASEKNPCPRIFLPLAMFN